MAYTKEQRKQYYIDNKQRIADYQKQYYVDNKESVSIKNRIRAKKSAANNKEKVKNYKRQYMKDRRIDPTYRMCGNLSRSMSQSFKTKDLSKRNRHWEDLVGYSAQDLKEHLESLFTDGMSWDNYGEWHIDHKIPKSFFDYNDEVEFRYCWSLLNLQPLWADDNYRKNNIIRNSKCLI